MARHAVVVRLGGRRLALPVDRVIETMRPLPIDADGTAQIRGERCRVLDAAALLGLPPGRSRRFVVVRDGDRRAALAVEAVLAVEPVDGGAPVEPVAEAALFAGARWLA